MFIHVRAVYSINCVIYRLDSSVTLKPVVWNLKNYWKRCTAVSTLVFTVWINLMIIFPNLTIFNGLFNISIAFCSNKVTIETKRSIQNPALSYFVSTFVYTLVSTWCPPCENCGIIKVKSNTNAHMYFLFLYILGL